MKRLLLSLLAAPLPTLAVMFCAGRTDLMSAPVTVRFGCLVAGVVAAIMVFVLTEPTSGVMAVDGGQSNG